MTECDNAAQDEYEVISSVQFYIYCACGLGSFAVLLWLIYKKALLCAIVIQAGYMTAYILKAFAQSPNYTPDLIAQPVSRQLNK